MSIWINGLCISTGFNPPLMFLETTSFMFNHCLTTDSLEEALLDAMIELNDGECLDDSIEFDELLAAQHPAEHQAMCEAYRVQLDVIFYLENPEYAE